jgi:hypothetical protein
MQKEESSRHLHMAIVTNVLAVHTQGKRFTYDAKQLREFEDGTVAFVPPH